jgi:dCMP deaminase
MLADQFSTCSKNKYASVVVAPNKRIVGFGYNGSPPGIPHCSDGFCPRLHENSAPGSSYKNCIAQHAEAGALMWSEPSLRIGATIIVNGPPCWDCSKLIASSGIIRIVHYADINYLDYSNSESILLGAGLQVFSVNRPIPRVEFLFPK